MAEDLLLQVEDPLKDYNGLSLFPRTLSSLCLPNPPPPLSTHDFLKSLPVRNPDKLIKEAESIINNATTQVSSNPKMTNSEDKIEVEKAVKYPRGQRPGLNRKRPRFSLLPNMRQPNVNLEPALDLSNVNLEPTLDFDKLKDPEEFFLAYERLENAKKEIAKQTGRAYMDSDQYNVFNVPRSQRPGIEGRSRTVKYKHLYPSMHSQGISEVDIISNCGSQQEIAATGSQQTQPAHVASQELEQTDDVSQQAESANAASEEMELAGSVLKVENKVNKLLDDLLASEELVGDGALNLLQDRLQIGPIHMPKLNLPELQDTQRINFKASGVNLPKPKDILSDINNLMKETRSKTPMKLKNAESSVNVGSPTPPKSPWASLSLLKQRIFQSSPSNDPFSPETIDQLPARNASHVENIQKLSDPFDAEKTLGVSSYLKSGSNDENDGAVGSISSAKLTIEDFTSLSKKCRGENSTSLGSDSEIHPRESGLVLDSNSVGVDNEVMNANLSQAVADIDLRTKRPNEIEDMVEDVLQEAVTSSQPDQETDDVPSNNIQNKLGRSNPAANYEHAADRCPEFQDGAPEQAEGTSLEQHDEEIQEPTVVSIRKKRKEKLRPHKRRYKKAHSRRQSLADPTMVENQAMDGCQEYQDRAQEQNQGTGQEQNNEKIQEPSVVSIYQRTKAKSHSDEGRMRKAFSRRQSLAGCGMSWETGVRRSTRIKSRPLEYWKGEKFLYGRIHESLATIIGIKYASPGKDNGTLKVKSFVSENYKDLVDQAGLY